MFYTRDCFEVSLHTATVLISLKCPERHIWFRMVSALSASTQINLIMIEMIFVHDYFDEHLDRRFQLTRETKQLHNQKSISVEQIHYDHGIGVHRRRI